mgnify:CR=1 FL=1
MNEATAASERLPASEPQPARQRYPFEFTGSGREFFPIWIVNVLLSIITLYVYSAWAKVRTRRYFLGNTVLDGSGFDYHATGLQILIGRVIAVLLFIGVTVASVINPLLSAISTVVFLLILPWAVWRSVRFNARMTSYRNVRFQFAGSLGRMYLYTLVLPFLPLVLGFGIAAIASKVLGETGGAVAVTAGAIGVFGFYLISPWVHRKLVGYLFNNYSYGTAPFAASLSTRRFYGIYLKSFLLALLVLVVLAAIAVLAFLASNLDPQALKTWLEADEPPALPDGAGALVFWFVLALYASFFFFGYFIMAFFRSRVRNHVLGSTVIDGKVEIQSTFRARSLCWLMVTNVLLLVVTLGLGWAWTKVRTARFQARYTAAQADDGLHSVIDVQRKQQSSLGEEIGDAFDMDVGIGF